MDLVIPFRHEPVLFLLVVPALLLVRTWTRRGPSVVLPFDHRAPARRSRLHLPLLAAESLPALLLAAVVLILAGPQTWAESRTRRVVTNIEFCVDVSGSMTARFGDGDRYDASMRAINAFLDRRTGDSFGLTFFGNHVLHWVPLTSDVSAFRCAPPFMHPANLPHWFNGTEIGRALLACRKVLVEREEGDRMIVLISDGESFDLDDGKDVAVARALRDDEIVVYGIHVAEDAVPDEIVNVTTLTGGAVFQAGDPQGLEYVFAKIDAMQQTRVETIRAEPADHFAPYAATALGLLGAILLAAFGLRSTPW